ncbi:MAG: thrombospondin type 3 repeat-containing protein, partial [Nitrospirae bacterium]|nr:thrombospondin type 3 repeat-containing protein [Nitrospirota bacterium]
MKRFLASLFVGIFGVLGVALTSYASVPVTVGQASVPSNSATGVTINTQALNPGEPLFVMVYHDVDGDGVLDTEDWHMMHAWVGDNGPMKGYDNHILPDSNPAQPGITTGILFPYLMGPGHYIVQVWNSAYDNGTASFEVTAAGSSHHITGQVLDILDNPVPDALVALVLPSPIDDGDIVYTFGFTNALGQYELEVPDAALGVTLGLGTQKQGMVQPSTSELMTVVPPEIPSMPMSDLVLVDRDATITGSVTDYFTSAPVAAADFWADSSMGDDTEGMSDPAGFFEIGVLSGRTWWIGGDAPWGYFSMRVPTNGYSEGASVDIPAPGTYPNANVVAYPEESFVDATVYDENGTQPVENALVFARNTEWGTQAVAGLRNGAFTDASGHTRFGIMRGQWEAGTRVNEPGHPTKINTVPKELVPAPMTSFSMVPAQEEFPVFNTYNADGAIEGYVMQGPTPMPWAEVYAKTIDQTGFALNGPSQMPIGGHLYTSTETDELGHFRLPVLGGTWWLRAESHEGECFQSPWYQVYVSTDGNEIIESPNAYSTNEVVTTSPLELTQQCNHCGNGVQDADETGVDCGGADCAPCYCPSEPEPNDTDTQAYPVPFPYLGDGTINSVNDQYDWYSFSATDGQTIYVDLTWNNDTPMTAIDMWLMDNTFSEIAFNFAGTSPGSMSAVAPYTGTYYVQLGASGIDACYRMSISNDPGMGHCTNGVQDSDESGEDCGGVNCPPCGGGSHCSNSTQDADETGVDCGGADCTPCGGCTSDAEPNDNDYQAVSVGLPYNGPGTIDSTTDQMDWYTFQANSGDTINVAVNWNGGPTGEITAWLMDDTFMELDFASGNTSPHNLSGVASYTGAYYVQISAMNLTACYNIDISTGTGGGGHCTNLVQDADESGMDCGGVDCPPCLPLGLSEDFETGAPGWTMTGMWHDTDHNSAYPNSHSPNHSMWYGQEATGNYNNGLTNTGELVSPQFAVPVDAVLTYWTWEQTECSNVSCTWDTRKVYISTDNGVSWAELHASPDFSASWYQMNVPLGSYAGMNAKVKFVFDSVDGMDNAHRGWYVDDVAVVSLPAHCTNAVQDVDETGVDCGGSCPPCAIQDADGDGVADGTDNCPNASNADQTDSDTDGDGDACDNCVYTANADQADTDSDGDGNVCDNCPNSSNADQNDWDSDGVGDACDNCIYSTNASQTDTDADGKGDACDNCPNDANADQADLDYDGIGDVCDTDKDADGVLNASDNCPSMYNPDQADGDSDGMGDVCEDADHDGVVNGNDNCPNTINPVQMNSDGDTLGDACDACPYDWYNDSDGDGVCADVDNCPNNYNPTQVDTDSDGTADACDTCPNDPMNDNDSDGVCGSVDNCPDNYNPDQADTDSDGLGDVCEDNDSDGILNAADNCPNNANPGQENYDGDGLGDVCDACPNDWYNDWDGDGVCGNVDNCQWTANADQTDTDGDGEGNACDGDTDGDGVGNATDNCPFVVNPGQEDANSNGTGDACEAVDADGDGIPDASDNCPNASNADQIDTDGDGVGNPCDNCGPVYNPMQYDTDFDGIGDACDNCPAVLNPDQADTDADGIGDACEVQDTDADGVPDASDNCPNASNADQIDTDGDGVGNSCDNCGPVYNPTQYDTDFDGIGDACDNCPAVSNPDQMETDVDGVGDACDNCPNTSNADQMDTDLDGIGDVCDTCPDDTSNDMDGDGHCGNADNCPSVYNPNQSDQDVDGIGDACDTDYDNDGVLDGTDNCMYNSNPAQEDRDADTIGDVCDTCPDDTNNDMDGDGVCGNVDNCPSVYNPNQSDQDADGIGDACD